MVNLSNIESVGMFKLVLYLDAMPVLMLWTFSPDVRYQVSESIRPYLNIGKLKREPYTLEWGKG